MKRITAILLAMLCALYLGAPVGATSFTELQADISADTSTAGSWLYTI